MQSGLVEENEAHFATPLLDELAADPRWHLIQRIAQSDSFQKSSRLPTLILYLARCTLLGDRRGLTEQSIGRAVFHKREDYTPTEDSSVRVYIRQLRIRLKEFYEAEGRTEEMVVDLPKGGYALSFTPAVVATLPALPVAEPAAEPVVQEKARQKRPMLAYLAAVLAVALLISIAGWWVSAARQRGRTDVPWPLKEVISDEQTTLVLADAGYSLRLLGDQAVPLDRYIDRSYLKRLIPEHMDKGEARLLHYLAASQLTSIADANAAAAIGAVTAQTGHSLLIRSARDLNASDLTRGDLIFVGARTSNPWVALYDEDLNYQVVEELAPGTRLIRNRHPLPGEQATYSVPESTGTSGEDYAVVAMLPNRSGHGNVLLLQGIRMEGTEAAIRLLQNSEELGELQKALAAANGGTVPTYFEALLHARSVAGAPLSVEFVSIRPFRK